jgi:HAD superfamily hydrolase (TIGR01490 family)
MAAAFFDVDGTLWAEQSMVSFYRSYLLWHQSDTASTEWAAFLAAGEQQQRSGASREDLNRWFYARCFTGLPVARVREAAQQWYRERVNRPGFLFSRVLERAREHRAQGHELVFVSGSFADILEPLARSLEVTEVLAAPLEIRGSNYTGQLLGPPTIGAGKAAAVERFLRARSLRAEECFGYADDASDQDFLECFPHPTVVVREQAEVPAFASARGWAVLRV